MILNLTSNMELGLSAPNGLWRSPPCSDVHLPTSWFRAETGYTAGRVGVRLGLPIRPVLHYMTFQSLCFRYFCCVFTYSTYCCHSKSSKSRGSQYGFESRSCICAALRLGTPKTSQTKICSRQEKIFHRNRPSCQMTQQTLCPEA